jgi:dienelactone hydrolase
MDTPAAAQAPRGEVKGTAWQHTPASLEGLVARASVALPAPVTGGAPYLGPWKDMPAGAARKVPVVLFLHGSSGLGLEAIGEWQAWLAGLGVASMAPDSFALPGRVTYTSPLDQAAYERIHALRAAEIAPALAALQRRPWADPARLVLAGASEGGVPVARYGGSEFAARMIFSWSCEDNYFVDEHRTAVLPGQPVLNVMSASDPFFGTDNRWLGNPQARGHAGEAFKDSPAATIVLVPGAPHTLLNLPQARAATRAFLESAVRPGS